LRERRRPFGRPRRRFQDNIGVLAGCVREEDHLEDLGVDFRIILGFWWGCVREEDQLEDLGVDFRIILGFWRVA
jgi:hypothetical protein